MIDRCSAPDRVFCRISATVSRKTLIHMQSFSYGCPQLSTDDSAMGRLTPEDVCSISPSVIALDELQLGFLFRL